jgi:hypothetical protein
MQYIDLLSLTITTKMYILDVRRMPVNTPMENIPAIYKCSSKLSPIRTSC